MVAAKSKKKTKPAAVASAKSKKAPKKQPEQEDILQAIDAMSDESDEDAGQVIEDASEDEGEWDAEALALRQMISDGKFNDLLKQHDKKKQDEEDSSEEEEVDEEELASDGDDASDDGSDEEQEENDESESSDDDEEEEGQQKSSVQDTRATALQAAIQSSNRRLPFAESFTVVPPTPLPFGPPAASAKSIAVGVDDDEEESGTVDIHDDLKREVAFYDTALEAVNIARGECKKVRIPFTRPEDFFAEMIKTDGEFDVTLLLLHCFSMCTSSYSDSTSIHKNKQNTWPKSKTVSSLKPRKSRQSNAESQTKNKLSWPKNAVLIV